MPLDKSGSKQAVGNNISQLRADGYKQKQAVAIALHVQREKKTSTKSQVKEHMHKMRNGLRTY